ncbi:MAG: 16S rRNA processing protein RimM [Clostridiales bacterium]|nr:16S rRNA processing protein RimM [Clostridiales bacterium]
MLSEYLLIGEVLRPQGVKGLVKVRPDTDDPYRYEDLEFVFIKKGASYEKIEIADVSVRDDGVYLRLNGVQDRNEAEKQRGMMLYVDRPHARVLEEGETFICDLIGCKAVDFDGNELGIVKDVLQPGGNDVYVIKTPKGEMLLPAVRHIVPEIDVEKGIMKVDASRLHEVAVCSWE